MQKNQFALLSEEIDKKFCVFWSICIGDWAKKIQNLDGTFVVDFCGGVRFLAINIENFRLRRAKNHFLQRFLNKIWLILVKIAPEGREHF